MVRSGTCKHFTGLGNEACAAGVRYDDVKKTHEPLPVTSRLGRPSTSVTSFPCLAEYNPAGAVCEKCAYPTAEEVAVEEAEMKKRMADTMAARGAIVKHLGGPWKKGTPGSSGRIDCPVCGAKGGLSFSRSGYNGHVHARCATPTCVSWME